MNYSSISTTEYKWVYAFIAMPTSKYFCSKWSVYSDWAIQLRRLPSSVAKEIIFSKPGSFSPLLDHIWTADSSICTGMNEIPFQGKEIERRWNSSSFTLGMWDVSRGGTFSFPSYPTDLCNTWVQSWFTFTFPQRVQQLQWRWEYWLICLPSSLYCLFSKG